MSYLLRGSFIFIFAFYGCCRAMQFPTDDNFRNETTIVVKCRQNHAWIKVQDHTISVLRSASPYGDQPENYCKILGGALDHAIKRSASPLLNGRSTSEYRVHFGDSLLPALEKIKEGDSELRATWKNNLKELMESWRQKIRITHLQIMGNSAKDCDIVSGVIEPTLEEVRTLDVGWYYKNIN